MARRAQFSIREGDTFESEGREAKRKIMQRASSMSRTASMNVGYLRRNEPWWIQQGGLFHFVQDHGRGFLVGKEEEVARRLLFGITAHEFLGLATVLHFDVGLATVVDNLEGEALNISPDPSERWYD